MKDEFFHTLNRGIDDRKIFLKKENYLRFVHDMEDFNDKLSVILSYIKRRQSKMSEMASPTQSPTQNDERKELISILCWSLMPNHYHIFSQEKIDGGVSEFTRRIGIGYTMYFNLENKRNGVLFKGRSKIIPIREDAHFLHLPYYILANPLDLYQSDWRENGIRNPKKAFEFLENYPWSSLRNLLGKNNFPEVINKKLFYELYDTHEKKFRKDFIEWLGALKSKNFDLREMEG